MGLLAPGAVLAGYRIESVVGRGGMGVVYRARELELDRVVALKVIAPELVEDRSVRARFLREARAAASIEHPNVIPVHAAGAEGDLAFLAMRFIEGDDARTLVRREGALSPGRAAEMITQVAAGLDAIHRSGYVHRDVKPANVLVDEDGHVYVTDFGLAKQILERAGKTTRSGEWVGTLDYIAPEQIRGGRIDARADIYALGGVLCFLLTGRVPFERDGDEAKLWAQLSDPPPVPSQVYPGLPPELDGVVTRAMAKSPDERYPSAGDLGRAARAAAAGAVPSQPERVVARGPAAPDGATAETGIMAETSTVTAARPAEPITPPTSQMGSSPLRRVWWPIAALGAAAAIVAIVLASLEGDPASQAARSGAPPTPTPTATATPAIKIIHGVGHRPNGIAVADGTVWVTSRDRPEVERIDAAGARKLSPLRGVGGGASAIVSDGRNLWVARKSARELVRIDAHTGRITARVHPRGVPSTLATGFGSLWVRVRVSPSRVELVRLNLHGKVLSRWPMRRGMAALATGNGSVWIVERHPPKVRRIDPRTGSSQSWDRLAAGASKLVGGGGYIWATMGDEDMIARIRTSRRGITTTAAGHSPDTAVVAGDRVYVAANTDHQLRVFDFEGQPVGKPIAVAHNPFAITADDRWLWVTGTADHTVTRIRYR